MTSPVSAEGSPLVEVAKLLLPALSKDDFMLQVEDPLLLEIPTDGVLPAGYGGSKKKAQGADASPLGTVAINADVIAKLPRMRNLEGAQVYLLEGAHDNGSCDVGRDECTVTLSYDSVSRKHAEFQEGGGTWYVVDLGSHNGTFVNKKKIEPNERIPLEDRCSIWFGSFRAVFLSPEEFYDLVVLLTAGKN